MKYSLDNTIYAPASAPQKSGIIVVRISGKNTKMAMERLKLPELKPRYATVANIYHPATNDLIDNCVAIYYEAPHSFTGEDVLELSIHGGKAVLRNLLDALRSMPNYRFAEAGEFSMRALFNGKLDLTQVEGLADLVNSETAEQHKIAINQLSGSLSRVYESWRSKLLQIMGLIEAHIDFPEEDIPDDLVEQASLLVQQLNSEIKSYLQDNNVGEKLRDGLYITILGLTNVGKSSLINKLSKRDVAIVSNIAGTTRDVIEVELEIKGYPVILADTAGIRESAEVIENEGIRRALERAKSADCRLIMLDATSLLDEHPHSASSQRKLGSRPNPRESGEPSSVSKSSSLGQAQGLGLDPSFRWDDAEEGGVLDLIDSNSIVVANKIDLLQSKPTTLSIAGKKVIFISTQTGEGLDELIDALSEFTKEFFYSTCATPLITRQRHRKHLTDCSECLSRFEMTKGIEFAAEDLRLAASHLARITERIDADSILGEIFSNFCIGK